MRVFSSCAGLYVRALFVKKGICACPNLPLNSYPAYYRGPISDEERSNRGKGGKKEDNFFVSTVENCSLVVDAKKRFWILFSSGGRDGFE